MKTNFSLAFFGQRRHKGNIHNSCVRQIRKAPGKSTRNGARGGRAMKTLTSSNKIWASECKSLSIIHCVDSTTTRSWCWCSWLSGVGFPGSSTLRRKPIEGWLEGARKTNEISIRMTRQRLLNLSLSLSLEIPRNFRALATPTKFINFSGDGHLEGTAEALFDGLAKRQVNLWWSESSAFSRFSYDFIRTSPWFPRQVACELWKPAIKTKVIQNLRRVRGFIAGAGTASLT